VLSGPDELAETDAVAGLTVTVACADLLESATLVAVTVAVVGLVTIGALNAPLLEMEPIVADQVIAVLEEFVTWAANCWVVAETTAADVGEIQIATGAGGAGGSTVTVAWADLVLSAALVAFTVTDVVLVTVGAVNNPLLVMLPFEADHTTAVLEVLLTVAVNSWVEPDEVINDAGAIATTTGVTIWALLMMEIEMVAFPREFFIGSLTLTIKLNEPAVFGLPEISPFAANDNPGGKEPLLMTNV
jgi:hypothetical protein